MKTTELVKKKTIKFETRTITYPVEPITPE